MLLDNAPDRGQSQAVAPLSLRGEKGFEYVFHILRVDAAPVVCDIDVDSPGTFVLPG